MLKLSLYKKTLENQLLIEDIDFRELFFLVKIQVENKQYFEMFNSILKFLNSSELTKKINLEGIKKISSYINDMKMI